MTKSTVTIYECEAGDFEAMSLPEAIAWLNRIAREQPCMPEDIMLEIEQRGDFYDGYNCATIKITRPETYEEERRRKAEEAAKQQSLVAAKEAEERAAYAILKAKFGQ